MLDSADLISCVIPSRADNLSTIQLYISITADSTALSDSSTFAGISGATSKARQATTIITANVFAARLSCWYPVRQAKITALYAACRSRQASKAPGDIDIQSQAISIPFIVLIAAARFRSLSIKQANIHSGMWRYDSADIIADNSDS